jgi:hypothetical protein
LKALWQRSVLPAEHNRSGARTVSAKATVFMMLQKISSGRLVVIGIIARSGEAFVILHNPMDFSNGFYNGKSMTIITSSKDGLHKTIKLSGLRR